MRAGSLLCVCVVAFASCDSGLTEPSPAPCAFDLSARTVAAGATGGPGSVTVTTASHCNWTARSEVSWISATGATSVTGPGTFNFTVAATSDSNARTGALTIAGQAVSVSQAGATTCEYAVHPVDLEECLRGGFERALTVDTAAGCTWTASTLASWLTISSGQTGAGPGAVTFTIGANYDAARQGTIEVRWPTTTAGQNVRVAQSGCLYGVSRDSFSVPAAGGDFTLDVYSSPTDPACGGPLQDACSWSAQPTAPWITILSSMPRNGDDRVSFRVSPNGNAAPRAATIVIRDRTVTITQAGS